MFELSGVNYEEVLEQGDSILVRVIASSSYREFESSGLYCMFLFHRFRTFIPNERAGERVIYGSSKISSPCNNLFIKSIVCQD